MTEKQKIKNKRRLRKAKKAFRGNLAHTTFLDEHEAQAARDWLIDCARMPHKLVEGMTSRRLYLAIVDRYHGGWKAFSRDILHVVIP